MPQRNRQCERNLERDKLARSGEYTGSSTKIYINGKFKSTVAKGSMPLYGENLPQSNST